MEYYSEDEELEDMTSNTNETPMDIECDKLHDTPIFFSGYMAYIVNIKAKGQRGTCFFQERKGAREDEGNIQVVFEEKLGFKCLNKKQRQHEDLSLEQWDHRKSEASITYNPLARKCENCLRCRISSEDHSRSKYFALVISSHGQELNETEVIFSDGNCLKLTEIIEALTDENIPSLAGKPRIIILQVCRSNFRDKEKVEEMQDRGVLVNYTETSGPTTSGSNKMAGHGATADDPIVNMSSDGDDTIEDLTLQQVALANMPENFVLVYPSVSGQLSKRNKVTGSWLIYGLNKIMVEYYCPPNEEPKPVNFLQYLTKVSRYIATELETVVFKKDENGQDLKDEEGRKIKDEEKSGFKNAVCVYHRLTENIVIKPNVRKQHEVTEPNLYFGDKKKKKKL